MVGYKDAVLYIYEVLYGKLYYGWMISLFQNISRIILKTSTSSSSSTSTSSSFFYGSVS